MAVPQVVERFEANREIIATAVNFLDRYVQSQLSTGELSNRQVAPLEFVALWGIVTSCELVPLH